MTNTRISISALFFLLLGASTLAAQSMESKMGAGTPPELVKAYDDLADTLLSAKATEKSIVLSILATTFSHAQATMAQASEKVAAGQNASAALEKLASLVSQMGNEGDASVAAVRKKLLEGGHHHNAAGEQQGLYAEGFVVVTKPAQKVFLEAATEIGKMSKSPKAAELKAQWDKVASQYKELTGHSH